MLCDLIGRSMLLELTQGFGLVTHQTDFSHMNRVGSGHKTRHYDGASLYMQWIFLDLCTMSLVIQAKLNFWHSNFMEYIN